MKILTLGKILNDYRDFLSDCEIEKLREIQKRPTAFATQAKELHRVLFDEETDYMLDSGGNSKRRSRGINPLSQEYTDRVNKKRGAFGVSLLGSNGFAADNSSGLFCEEVVRQTKNYKELWELKGRNAKQIVFVDMDDVLVNFQSGIDKISEEDKKKYGPDHFDNVPGIFALMNPYEGAIEGYKWLSKNFDTYILSTASWDNPSAWSDKLLWVKKHLQEEAHKRLILTHNKHLAKGDFLIDDRTANGAGDFSGKHIHFKENGKGFEDWKKVIAYLENLT